MLGAVQKGKKSYSRKIRPSSRDRSHNQINVDSRKEGALCPGRTGGPRGLCTPSARMQVACFSVRAAHKDKVTQVAILSTGCSWTKVIGGVTHIHTHTQFICV